MWVDILLKINIPMKNIYFCSGGSAGGLLIGAVINIEPTMWKGAIARVPFGCSDNDVRPFNTPYFK